MKDKIPRIHNTYDSTTTSGAVGFSEIPEQVRASSIEEGFHFNLLVVARRGLGTSTLVNSLFSAPLVAKDRPDGITTTVNEIIENEIKLTISVTTYHGEDMSKIFKHISAMNEEYFELEQGISLKFLDRRIHCCLYLVPGDKVSEQEIENLRELSKKVNVIPVITKADMFNVEELKEQREKITKIFEDNNIRFYDYGECDPRAFPMAVIASESVFEEDGYVVRGRKYLWGFIDIENEKFSDFKKLQKILISEKFINLIYTTDTVFYDQSRKVLMSNENSTTSKARLIRLLSQMDTVLDEKYGVKIKALEKEEASIISEFSDAISLKSAEVPMKSE